MLVHLRKKLNNLNFFKKTSNNDVFKNMTVLAMGVGSAQVIGLASSPLLTRIYSPEDFGLLSVFMAAVGILVPFSTLRYVVPIPLLKQDGIAINLFVATLVILLITTAITVFLLAFFAHAIFDLFSMNSLIPYWWLLPIAIFVLGLFEILNNWSIRQKNFKAIAKTNIFQTISSALMKIGFGLVGIMPMGLLIGTVFAYFFGSISLILSNYRTITSNIRYINKKRMRFLLARYVEYPKYRLPSQVSLVLSVQAPLLFLAAFFGSDTVGYFGLTMMVLSVPLTLFGNTTGEAYYAEIAKIGRKNPEKIYEVTKDVIKRLFLFSLAPFIILLIASPQLFSLVFGENWYQAGVYGSIMSFYMLAAFLSAPLANVFNVFEEQFIFLKLNIIRFLLLVIIFFISWLINLDSTETIIFYSVGMSMYFIYLSYYILKRVKNQIGFVSNAIKT